MNKSKTLKVGLTGGIGTGKSTVARIFEAIEIPVYYADERAKQLMITDKIIISELTALLGREVYYPDGNINKSVMRTAIYNDKNIRHQVNSIVHPVVHKDLEEWFQQQQTSYAIEEAAILIESGNHHIMDKIIVVDAPKDIVIQRISKRDNFNLEEIEKRIASQMDSVEKKKYADYIIDNSGEKPLVPQVWKIHLDLLKELGVFGK